MPVDVAADVIANRRALGRLQRAVARGAGDRRAAAPGQFVMVKASTRARPAAPPAVSRSSSSCAIRRASLPASRILKQTHRSVDSLAVRRAPGPAGRVSRPARPPVFARRRTRRSLDGRRRRRARAVCDAGRSAVRARRPPDALLRRATGRGAVLSGFVPRARRRPRADDRGRHRPASAAAIVAPLDRRLAARTSGCAGHDVRVRPRRHARGRRENRCAAPAARARCRSNASWAAAWAAATAASSRCAATTACSTTCDRAWLVPCLPADQIRWD